MILGHVPLSLLSNVSSLTSLLKTTFSVSTDDHVSDACSGVIAASLTHEALD